MITSHQAAYLLFYMVSSCSIFVSHLTSQNFLWLRKFLSCVPHTKFILLPLHYISYWKYHNIIFAGDKGGHRTALGWETRYQIALGAARGIAYIHSRGPNISHGNIKSSNILLTETYEAHISDYGLAILVGPRSRFHCYLPPEVTETQTVSQKADVYCYGVLILELLTGKSPDNMRSNEESGLGVPRWVYSVVRQEWIAEVFDPELLRYENVNESMVQLLQVAMECTALDPGKRPSMAEVKKRIRAISP